MRQRVSGVKAYNSAMYNALIKYNSRVFSIAETDLSGLVKGMGHAGSPMPLEHYLIPIASVETMAHGFPQYVGRGVIELVL
jgi:hypothetical protein